MAADWKLSFFHGRHFDLPRQQKAQVDLIKINDDSLISVHFSVLVNSHVQQQDLSPWRDAATATRPVQFLLGHVKTSAV